jgi:hypothetical protein
VPAINSRLASLEAVVQALNAVPGMPELEAKVEAWVLAHLHSAPDTITGRIAALENWASGLGLASHNSFVAAPPTSQEKSAA